MSNGCDQCAVISINGTACHEIGCPNRHIDPVTGRSYMEECRECGGNYTPKFKGDPYCYNCKRTCA